MIVIFCGGCVAAIVNRGSIEWNIPHSPSECDSAKEARVCDIIPLYKRERYHINRENRL